MKNIWYNCNSTFFKYKKKINIIIQDNKYYNNYKNIKSN